LTLNTNIKILDTVFLQTVDDATILLDTTTEEYFSLNEIGAIFYEILQEEQNLGKVIDILKEGFDITEEQLKTDLFAFIKALEEKGLLVTI